MVLCTVLKHFLSSLYIHIVYRLKKGPGEHVNQKKFNLGGGVVFMTFYSSIESEVYTSTLAPLSTCRHNAIESHMKLVFCYLTFV